MAPPHHTLARGFLRAWRAWHAAPGTGAAPRHWAPPPRTSLAKGHHQKVIYRGAQSYASHASTRSLTGHFLALLRTHVDPALRGAFQVLRHTRPTPNNILTPQFRQAAASARLAFARAPKRPTVDACKFGHSHELGLQTARRHFSQSTAQTAQQTILGLRLAADEARDKLFYKDCQQPQQQKTLRRPSKRQKTALQSQRFQTDIVQVNKSGRKSSSVRSDARLSQLDLYFPEPATAAARAHEVAAEIIVPLDPDLSNIWDLSAPHSQPSAASAWPEQGPIYDGELGTATLHTSSAYQVHLQNTRRLQHILQDVCACVLTYDERLAHAPHAAHGVGFKIVVPGFTAAQLREILIDRLGVEQGLWFSKLLRDVSPSYRAYSTMDIHDDPHRSTEHAGSAQSSPILFSPPRDEYDNASLSSSWDGMLYEPPPEDLPGLEFSSEFIESLDESRYPSYAKASHFGLYSYQDEDSSLYLQDSR